MKKIKRLKCLLMLTLICGMMITALPAEVFATESVLVLSQFQLRELIR